MTLSSDPRTAPAPVKLDFSATRISPRSTVQLAQNAPPKEPRGKLLTIPLPGTDSVIKANVPMASLTSFRVGGPAEWYVAPRQLDELYASLEWARSQGLPVTMLGAGSNLLVSDQGIPGLIISTRFLRYAHFDEATGRVTVGAGEPLPRLAWKLADRGWQGFEWAVGIPGTVGGAVVMNAGAHGDSIADILVDTHVLLPNGTTKILTPQELHYQYRTSALQGSKKLVTQATFQLQPGADPEALLATTQTHKQQRQQTQPYDFPSCGSVFRNPDPHKAGWLIEQTGLKGHQIGGAQVAQRHANFILNCGGATATDIFQLIRYVQYRVQQEWALWLEPEVKMLGNFQAT
jgi:UDP-N-acetylmuramate dehydrogenase